MEECGDPGGGTVVDDDSADFASTGAEFEWAPSGWLLEEAAPFESCFDGADDDDDDDDIVDEGEDEEVENRARLYAWYRLLPAKSRNEDEFPPLLLDWLPCDPFAPKILPPLLLVLPLMLDLFPAVGGL